MLNFPVIPSFVEIMVISFEKEEQFQRSFVKVTSLLTSHLADFVGVTLPRNNSDSVIELGDS
jgi:hypothetical protein